VRGAIRNFIEATTPYRVCDGADHGVAVIHQKATESRCDLILLHLRTPIRDSVETASLLRRKLPCVKIVGFSTLARNNLGNQLSAAPGFDAMLEKQDGLSKLVETLKALMPERPRS
jgi:DNA-binding NarL/FixJ family response regulator